MTQKRFSARIALTIIATLLIIGTLCTVGLAASFEEMNKGNYSGAYGQAVPTDEKLNAKVSQYKFNGDEGTLYFMQISKGKPNAYYAVEIFTDNDGDGVISSADTKIRSFSKQFSTTAGNTPLKIKWEFKTTVSGNYLGRCYTYYETKKDSTTTQTADTASMSTFKINIDRVGSKVVTLKSLVNSATGPKLTWEPLPTGSKYNVYRKAAGAKSWTYLTTLAGAASSYVDTTAKSGTTYTYTVKCSDGKFISKYDTKGLTIKCLSMPKISVIGSGSTGTAVVKWDAVTGANGYYVYRKGGNLSNYNWKLIATIKNGKTVSYTDTTATSTDWNYTYTVKAFSGSTVSAYNYNGVDFDYIKAPTLKRASSGYGGMLVEWANTNENVTGYYVYRLNGKTWKYLGSTTAKSFLDKTAQSTKSYTYTVKAFSDTNVGGYNTKGITAKYLAAPVLASKVTFDSNYRSIVSWSAVEGANGYVVYRKINNAKSWTAIQDIRDGKTTVFYDASKKASGNTYTYTVRAYDKSNLFSFFKAEGMSGVCLAKPVFTAGQVSTEDNSLAIQVAWGEITGATKYSIYRKGVDEAWGSQHCIATVTDTSYIDTDLVNGSTYEYAVRARNELGDVSAFYTKSATAITVPEISDVTVADDATTIIWEALEGIDSYNVYRMPKDGTDWELIASTPEAEYKDDSETSTTTAYYYAVSSVIGEIESAKSAPVGNFAEVKLEASVADDGIKLDWVCDSYTKATLRYSTSTENDVFLKAFDNGDFSHTDNIAEKGKTYTYTITVEVTGKVDGVASVTIRRPYDPLEATTINSIKNVTDPSNNLFSVRINWKQVDHAEKYVVLRASDDGFLNWTEIGTVAQEDAINGVLSFTDNTVTQDKKYAYKIKATAPVADRPESESEYKTITLLSPLADILDMKVAPVEGNPSQVKITWAPVKNAEGYRIYRTSSPSIDESWEQIGERNSSTTEFVDDYITESGSYYYKLEAWSTDRGQVSRVFPEPKENGVDVKLPLKPAVIKQIGNASTNVYAIKLVWDLVDEAEQYTVIKSADNGETWEEIATYTVADSDGVSITHIDTNVEPEVNYIYKIKATAPLADLPESESLTEEYTLPVQLLSFSKAEAAATEDNKTVVATWTAVVGAEKYVLYRTTTPDVADSWKQVGVYKTSNPDTTEREISYTDASLEEDGVYTYKIVAISEALGEVEGVMAPVEITGFSEEVTPEEPTDPEAPVDPETPDKGETTDPSTPDGGEVTNPSTPDDGEATEPDNGEVTDPSTPDDGEATEPSTPDDNTGSNQPEDEDDNPGMGVI